MNWFAFMLSLHLPRWVTCVNAAGDDNISKAKGGKAKGGKAKGGKAKGGKAKGGKAKGGKTKGGKKTKKPTKSPTNSPTPSPTKAPTAAPSDSSGLVPTSNIDNYYYTRVLKNGQEDMIFENGPISIISNCTGNKVYMKLMLNNTAEDMLVFGSINNDFGLDASPIGDSSAGVLDAGVIYEETMWNVTSAGNDRDYGAVAIRALTSNDSYYVGWDGESFIGIASEDGLDGGYDCSMAGVFYYSFPNSVKSTILNVNPVGPAPEDGPDTYYYNKVLKNGQEDIIFDKGPIKITSQCSGNETYMKLKLNNSAEDMLVFGDIWDDSNLDSSPIGDSSDGVLDAGAIYEEIMWHVTGAGNDIDNGAVAVRTLKSDETYYVGWDGESFVGIASEDGLAGGYGITTENGLAGGYDCAMAGVFHYSFPENEKSTILNMNSVGPGPEDSANSYYYNQSFNDGQEDIIFDKGPVRITSHCAGNETYMKLKLNNTVEDMLVFGSIEDDYKLDGSPIGNSSYGVLDAGVIYEEIMWRVTGRSGNDVDDGAVAIRTLASDKAYYVGWDGESFVGIANENGLTGGYDCAMAGVFHYSFPA
eukprot:scaffold1007_cov23-Cyclotella_meneghiniana.AAC.2